MNLTENLGKIAKNAVGQFKESMKQSDIKEEYKKSLEKALTFLDIRSSKSPVISFLRTFIFFNIQAFIFSMNALSVISLVLVTDYRRGNLSQEAQPIFKLLEWILGGFFTLEVALEIFFNYRGLLSVFKTFLSVGNIIDILLSLEIVYSTMYIEDFKHRNWFWVLVGFLRSLKLIKLRTIIEFNLKQLRKIIENNKLSIDMLSNEEDDLKSSLISSGVDILVGIFIESTALMAVNEILDYQAFTNSETFTYIGSAYYTIVSLTSIGYGDVLPIKWESRAFIVVMLLFNISVLSTFLANLTDRLGKLSPYVKKFSLKNHVVIIGEIPLTFLQFFIEELNENDKVNGRLKEGNQGRIKILIVGSENPPRELERWIHQFNMKEQNEEIDYLKSNIMENKWLKQSNVHACKHLFAFSINMSDSETIAFEKDKHLAFNVQNLISRIPNLPITLTLSTNFEDIIRKDCIWNNVQTVPFRLLNNYIMANSLENQGFNTWLVHLLTLREKREPKLNDQHKDTLMGDYAKNMRQEIYPISL